MRKRSTNQATARFVILVLWVVVLAAAFSLLNGGGEPTQTSSLAPDAATTQNLMTDVSSGTTLQGSTLPLDVGGNPQQTARPNQ